ncbi:hypothetical protein Rcae01_00327 [Novipirellula caenicola]|uniref:Uncharacterized protein n=1 Tax=Novipirellula caenicola TaxID=1536901 RepID=A0ABP9VL62_9BACT
MFWAPPAMFPSKPAMLPGEPPMFSSKPPMLPSEPPMFLSKRRVVAGSRVAEDGIDTRVRIEAADPRSAIGFPDLSHRRGFDDGCKTMKTGRSGLSLPLRVRWSHPQRFARDVVC